MEGPVIAPSDRLRVERQRCTRPSSARADCGKARPPAPARLECATANTRSALWLSSQPLRCVQRGDVVVHNDGAGLTAHHRGDSIEERLPPVGRKLTDV